MTKQEILKHVDHTLLKPTATWHQIDALCKEALHYKTASICIPPHFVKTVKQQYESQIPIGTVIGFPLGYHTRSIKAEEAMQALRDGADELDMVINLGDAKTGDFQAITEEIKLLKDIAGDKILKVIIEACYLNEAEKMALCGCVTKAQADYIKTSTGFGSGGATIEDVLLFKKHIGSNVKIKASGGIKSVEDMERFLNAGCERLGTSSAIILIEDKW